MTSLRGRLNRWILAGFSVLLMAGGLVIYALTRAALYRGFDDVLRAKAMLVMAQTEQTATGVQLESAPALTQQFGAPEGGQFFQIRGTNGELLARSGSLGDGVLAAPGRAESRTVYRNQTLPGGIPGRVIGLGFRPKMEEEPAGGPAPAELWLVVAADRRELEHTLGVLGSVLGFTGLLILALAVPFVGVAVRCGQAPLEALAARAASINADCLAVRFPVAPLPKELQPIGSRFNDLLARLERAFVRERRFSADVAHELRTPLAELRALAEVGLLQFADGEARELCAESLAIALQMQAMLSRLQELSRCENGRLTLTLEAVRLGELVGEVGHSFAREAGAKNLALLRDIPETLEWRTDPPLLRSILVNLVANAVTYSPGGTRVELVWRSAGGELVIRNPVDDLEPADLPCLFDRFWRKDASRTGTEHQGLGLALSRTYAELLGLELTARFTDAKILEMVLVRKPEAAA